MVLGFVALRALNGYGDPAPRLVEGDAEHLAMSFFNVTKYPPSLLFLMMTLGPALVALPLLRRARGRLADVLVTYGRVPFLFYVSPLPGARDRGRAGRGPGLPGRCDADRLPLPAGGYGVGLPVIYLVWLAVVAALYPLCRRYAELKARSRAWWLSYL